MPIASATNAASMAGLLPLNLGLASSLFLCVGIRPPRQRATSTRFAAILPRPVGR